MIHNQHHPDQGNFHPDGGGHVVVLHSHHGLLLYSQLGRCDYDDGDYADDGNNNEDDGDDDDDNDDLLQPS